MSLAPVFTILAAAPAVTAIIKTGSGPVRCFPGDTIPQDQLLPCVVWRQQFGFPYNLLSERAPADRQRCELVSWAHTFDEANDLRDVVRYALELNGYAVGLAGDGYEFETKRYWCAIEWSFITPRDV